MVKSSKLLKYVGQYGFLVNAIAWIGNCIYNLSQGLWGGEWNNGDILAPGIIGLSSLMAFLYLRNKFVVVELGGQKVRIYKDNQTIETNWLNIESVEKLIFSTPPIYTIRLKDVNGPLIFWDSEFVLFWFDDTELGQIISKKKNDLDI